MLYHCSSCLIIQFSRIWTWAPKSATLSFLLSVTVSYWETLELRCLIWDGDPAAYTDCRCTAGRRDHGTTLCSHLIFIWETWRKKKRKKMRVKEKHKVRMLQRASCSAEPLSWRTRGGDYEKPVMWKSSTSVVLEQLSFYYMWSVFLSSVCLPPHSLKSPQNSVLNGSWQTWTYFPSG